MKKDKKAYANIVFYSFIVLLFIVSYLRFSYYINPNVKGEPVWIKIAGSKTNNTDLLDLNESNRLDINTTIKTKSIIVFWLLFGLTNLLLLYNWRYSKKDIVLFIVTWGGLTLLIIVFMGFHYIFKPEQVFFGLFTKIKNFLLSPLYTGVIFIFAKFFNRIVR